MNLSLISLFVVTLLFSYSFIFFINRSKLRIFFIDKPDSRKIHQIQIPRIGGFAFILSFLSLVFFLWAGNTIIFDYYIITPVAQAVFISALLIFILGFFDDTTFIDVNVPTKFGIQFLIALIVVYYFKLSFREILFLGNNYSIGYIGDIFTIFWIVGVINALNIIDGIDGLSAGVTLVAIGITSIIFFISGNSELLKVSLPLSAVIIGFLIHNYPPAKLFAGDTGSLFFGSIVAILSVKVATLSVDGIETISAFYIAFIPVIEVVVSIIRRYSYAYSDKKNITDSIKQVVTPDNLHMHHRLIFRGYSHQQALRFLLFFSISLSSIAIIINMTNNNFIKIGVALYSLIFLFLVLKRLEYGKKIFGYKQESVFRRKTLFLICENEYFDNSIRTYAGEKFWINSFSSFKNSNGRDCDLFIVYDNKKNSINLEEDIKKISKNLIKPIIIISDNFKENDNIFKNSMIYLVKKPIDMPYLLHDIEKIINMFENSKTVKLDETLTIEKNSDK